jgi:hypothetical protein
VRESTNLTRLDIDLRCLAGVSEEDLRSRYSSDSAVALVASLDDIGWVNLVLLSPRGTAFRAVGRGYPAFENDLLNWQGRAFDTYLAPEEFLRAWKHQGVSKANIPIWLVGIGLSGDAVPAFRNIGSKSIVVPRGRVVSLLFLGERLNAVLDYFSAQIREFEAISFVKIPESFDLDGLGSKLTPQLTEVRDNLDAQVFGAVPPRKEFVSRLPVIAGSLEQSIEQLESGREVSFPVSVECLLRPPISFPRSHWSARLTPTASILDPELEDAINGMRARLVRLLAWPNAFTSAQIQNKHHNASLKSVPVVGNPRFDVDLEIRSFLDEVVGQYPVVARSPF